MAGAVGVAAACMAVHRPDAAGCLDAGAGVHRGRRRLGRAGHVAHRQMARQAGVHPQPHARGDQGRARGAACPSSRTRSPATPTWPATRRRPTWTAPPARARRTGWSWSASARISAACRSASRAIRRLVLPVPRIALRHGRAHPQGAGAGEPGRAELPVHLRHQDPDRLRQGRGDKSMSGGHSTYTPKTGLGRWIDARMPLPRLVHDSFIVLPGAAQPQLRLYLRRHSGVHAGGADH